MSAGNLQNYQLMETYRQLILGPDQESSGCFNDTKFSDFTIRVKSREFRVHKVILYRGSDYFRRMFDGDWKENSLNEVDLEEDDPAAIEGMLRYIYGLDHNTECEEGSMEQARFNADLYAVADKYGLSLLREHALSEFTYYVGHYCDYDNGADVVRLLYAPTAISNPKLINILCHNIDKNIDCLIGDKYFIETFKEFPGFSSHYAEYVAINRRGGI